MYALLKRLPAWTWFLGVTLGSVALSLALTCGFSYGLKGTLGAVDLGIGLAVPLVLTPIILAAFHRLLSEVRRSEERLKILANEDPLTGVLNRRRFLEILEAEWSRARRYGRPLSLLLLDADHFKALNDEYGHLAGDVALKHIARHSRQSLRCMDVLGRFGGEEFMILLPETHAEAAVQVAERIRRALSERAFLHEGIPIKVAVSIGVADNVESCEDVHGLMRAADQALYHAKNDGRNRVALAADRNAILPISR